jgi:hypothetical protein
LRHREAGIVAKAAYRYAAEVSPSMYRTPTSSDFQRNLLIVGQKAREQAHADDQRIKVEYASRGLGQSGPLIGAVADRFDELHAEATETVMHLIRAFVRRRQLTPTELAAAARPELENLAAELVARIPSLGAGNQQATQQTQAKFTRTFQQRTDAALRDIEIGFIGGRDVAVDQPERNVQANAYELLKEIEHETAGSGNPVLLEQLGDIHMTVGEAKEAYHYLRDKGLIETNFLAAYAARVSALGHDAIREAETTPDKASRAFPAITYNYYLNVHTMTGSNIQQGTTNSQITATQTITTQQFIDGVRSLVAQIERALPTSDLPAGVQERTREALAELRAAAEVAVPDAGRLRSGLESLKHIMEHATGHLIATGALSLIAQLLSAVPAH